MFSVEPQEGATNSSPTDHQQYLRELERIRSEIAGFKPIDKPSPAAKSSSKSASLKPSSKSWKEQNSQDSGSDPFPGEDYY